MSSSIKRWDTEYHLYGEYIIYTWIYTVNTEKIW